LPNGWPTLAPGCARRCLNRGPKFERKLLIADC
jgi:hypothetical protein